MITLVPYIVGVVAAFIAIFLPRGKDVAVAVFLIPWVAFVIDFGASMRIPEFLAAILLLKYFFMGWLKPSFFKGGVYFMLFLGLALFTAYHTVQFGPAVPDFAGGSTLRNGYGRVFTATLNLALKFMLLLLLFSNRDNTNVLFLMKTYVISCFVLAVLGLFQLAVFMGSGVDLFPIGLFLPGETRFGAINIQGTQYLRVSSFGGEPKGLGQSLVVGFAIMLLFGRQFRWSRQGYLAGLGLLLLTIMATVSTSAFVTILVVLSMVFVMSRKREPFTGAGLLAIFLTVSLSMSAVFYGIVFYLDTLQPPTYVTADTFWEALKARTIGRIQFDDTDSIIWESFVGDYFGLILGRGLGLVHHYAYLFIPPHQFYYLNGSIIPPKSGLSFYFGNAGLLGLLAMTMLAAAMTPRAVDDRILSHPGKIKVIKQFQILCLSLWAAHLLRLYTFDITWVLFAIAAIAGHQLHARDNQPTRTR